MRGTAAGRGAADLQLRDHRLKDHNIGKLPGSMSSECRTQSPDPLTSHCCLTNTVRISHGFLSGLKYQFIKISSYNEVTSQRLTEQSNVLAEPFILLVTRGSLMLDVLTKNDPTELTY